jgi:hypothetical protein
MKRAEAEIGEAARKLVERMLDGIQAMPLSIRLPALLLVSGSALQFVSERIDSPLLSRLAAGVLDETGCVLTAMAAAEEDYAHRA